jgi:GNAT superfamily N-acetyltransferase
VNPTGRPDRIIRSATVEDVGPLVEMIRDLAEYERSPQSVEIEPSLLSSALFGDSPAVFAHVAEEGGHVRGMAIWFLTFSTWTGHHGIYLEDLFVRPEARSAGVGRALIAELAAIALQRGYKRIDWAVLNWNSSAIDFYRSIGATPMEEWTGYRLAGDALAALGS